MEYIAHTRNATGRRHGLEKHLRTVADLAAEYASAFEARELGHYLGLWHDVGKFNPKFQEYLLRCEADPSAKRTGPDHKAAGSEIAMRYLPLLALLVQGHHGGLHAPSGPDSFETWFQRKKLEDKEGAVQAAIEAARRVLADLEPSGQLGVPHFVESSPTASELFLRLLFSALVDADCLDTEAHFNREKAELRGSSVTMEELWRTFEASQASVKGKGSPIVAQARAEIYDACLSAAEQPPGLFRLTVPTGGGKTRSGMAFALRHAIRHGHRRVVVAVPFISITEQTAQTYREIFGPNSDENERPTVLEHHSGGQLEDGEDDYHPAKVWQRLASENWDAPIVVTTTVQLFESLFGNGTSRCRKLHRLARSVIILDEAQTLPAHLLRPILDALSQLCRYYGATVVLSTATQPAFDTIPDFRDVPATEIVENAAHYFEILKRVEYDWRTGNPMSWDEVAAVMSEERQVLAIVNTKKRRHGPTRRPQCVGRVG